ncbi:hypothetical protein OG245_00340 [Streptomyces sp. NBC_01116]|uniref:hypothetical protein n=1 Tax=Streptomyces sp. NBC_01116 TaxID=2903752 RepID=UPI003252B32B
MVEKIHTMHPGPQELWNFGRVAARTLGLRTLWAALPHRERAQLLTDPAGVITQFAKETALKHTGRTPERGFAVYTAK